MERPVNVFVSPPLIRLFHTFSLQLSPYFVKYTKAPLRVPVGQQFGNPRVCNPADKSIVDAIDSKSNYKGRLRIVIWCLRNRVRTLALCRACLQAQ